MEKIITNHLDPEHQNSTVRKQPTKLKIEQKT